MIEACNKIAGNNKEALNKVLDERLSDITKKTLEQCKVIEKSAQSAKSSLLGLNNFILGGLFVVIVLLAGNLYLVYDYTSENEKFLNSLDRTLRKETKYWWDEDNKQLYFKNVEGKI